MTVTAVKTSVLMILFLALSGLGCEKPEVPPQAVEDGAYFGTGDPSILVSFYTDYQCPNCTRSSDLQAMLLNAWPKDVAVRVHHFPLDGHPLAPLAAKMAEAAGEQGQFLCMDRNLLRTSQLWGRLSEEEFVDFSKQYLLPPCGLNLETWEKALSNPAYDEKIKAAGIAGEQLGVRGTPWVLVNGRPVHLWLNPSKNTRHHILSVIHQELSLIRERRRGKQKSRCSSLDMSACFLWERLLETVGTEEKAELILTGP